MIYIHDYIIINLLHPIVCMVNMHVHIWKVEHILRILGLQYALALHLKGSSIVLHQVYVPELQIVCNCAHIHKRRIVLVAPANNCKFKVQSKLKN